MQKSQFIPHLVHKKAQQCMHVCKGKTFLKRWTCFEGYKKIHFVRNGWNVVWCLPCKIKRLASVCTQKSTIWPKLCASLCMFSSSKDMQVWQSFLSIGGTDHATMAMFLWKVYIYAQHGSLQSEILLYPWVLLLLFQRTLPYVSVCV